MIATAAAIADGRTRADCVSQGAVIICGGVSILVPSPSVFFLLGATECFCLQQSLRKPTALIARDRLVRSSSGSTNRSKPWQTYFPFTHEVIGTDRKKSYPKKKTTIIKNTIIITVCRRQS